MRTLLFTAAFFMGSAGTTAGLHGQTVDEIIAKNLKARGGVDRLRKMQSEHFEAHIVFGSDPPGRLLVVMRRPGMMRQEVEVNGKMIVSAIDGTSGWTINPFRGNSGPEPMNSDQVKNMAGGADFEGPLLDYEKKFNRVKLMGKVSVQGRDAYKLMVTLSDGEIRNDYVDAFNFLEVKWEGKVTPDGNGFEVETYFSDYRTVNGVKIAFRLDSDSPGGKNKQQIIIDHAEVDKPVDPALFQPPQP